MSEWEPAPVAKPADDGWEPAPQPKVKAEAEQPTVFGDVYKDVPGYGPVVRAALGIAEQPGAGIYGLAQMSYGGLKASFKAAIAKTAGLSFGDTFNEEFKTAHTDLPTYVPLTPMGATITEKISHVMEKGLKAYGDLSYTTNQAVPSPFTIALKASGLQDKLTPEHSSVLKDEGPAISGAAGETLAMLSMLVLGPKGGKGEVKPGAKPGIAAPVDPIAEFATKYPATANAIDASTVGKITVPETMRVTDAINAALDKELGISHKLSSAIPGIGEFDVLSGVTPKTVSDKMKLLIMKYGADVPLADQIKLANAYTDQFLTLQRAQDAYIASNVKMLPSPDNMPKYGTITVGKDGKAYTPVVQDQLRKFYDGENARLQDWIKEAEVIDGKPYLPKGKKWGQEGAIDIELLTPGLRQLKEDLGKVEGVLKDATGAIIVFRGQDATLPENAAKPGTYPAVYTADNPYAASSFTHTHVNRPAALTDAMISPSKVYPFILRDGVEVIEFRGVNENGHFSWGEFDRRAAALKKNQILVARNSKDHGGAGGWDTGGSESSKSYAKYDQYAFTDSDVVVPLFDARKIINETGSVPAIKRMKDILGVKDDFVPMSNGEMFQQFAQLPKKERLKANVVDDGAYFDAIDWERLGPLMKKYDIPGDDFGITAQQFLVNIFKQAELKGAQQSELMMILAQKDAVKNYKPQTSWKSIGLPEGWLQGGGGAGGPAHQVHALTDAIIMKDPKGVYKLTDPEGTLIKRGDSAIDLAKYHDEHILPDFGPDGSTDWSKQSGAIEIKGVEQNIPAAGKLAKELTKKGWANPVNPQQAAAQADRALEQSYKHAREANKIFTADTIKAVRRLVVGHDYDLQKGLKEAGPAGEAAQLQMNVQHNATMVAKSRFDKTGAAIFDNLVPEQIKNLEKIIRLRRIIQVDKYKGVGAVRHELDPVTKQPITGPTAKALLDQMEGQVKDFDVLDSKATAVFSEHKANLRRLKDEGLISEAEFDKHINLDQVDVVDYFNVIDPELPVTVGNVRRVLDVVRSSGIPIVERNPIVKMDARTVLIEDIGRTENRIAVNKTLQAIDKVAEIHPDNGIVQKVTKSMVDDKGRVMKNAVPDGWTSIGFKAEGKQQHFLIRDEFAGQLLTRADFGMNKLLFNAGPLDVTLGSIVRTVTASSLVRATATTYNPSFIIAGLPMDTLHLWMSTKDLYSPHLPKYATQIGADLAVTAKDAFFRTGRWEQAMLEGMGPNFLTHESRALGGLHSTISPKLQKLRTALSFMGDFQDMWVRLAHRERLIKSGVDAPTATAMAVERLNYSRGGALTKWVDNALPYTNITVNSLSKVLENAKDDPGGTATKVGWVVGTSSATVLANMIAAPETWKAISPEDKVRNFNLTFGDQFFVTDADGNKRYIYANLRLDQSVTPIHAGVVAGLEMAEYGRVPDGVATKAIGQVNPLQTMFVPSWQAYRAYADNYDPFQDNPIYKGPNVRSEDQFRSFAKSSPTGSLARGVGAATGLSPMGLEAGTRQLLNTNNFFIQAAGGSLKLMFEGMNPRDQAQIGVYMLQNIPGLRSVVKLTTPGNQMMKDLEKVDKEVNSVLKRQIDGLEERLFLFDQKKLGMREVENYIREQPPEVQKHLAEHTKYVYNVNKVLKDFKASEGIPPRAWWITSARISEVARAQVFYNEWISAAPEDRERMFKIASSLQNAGTGYMSQGFVREFHKQRQLLGIERR